MTAEVIRVSITSLNQMIELTDVFPFNFIMPMFLNFVDEIYTLKDVFF